MFRGPMLPILLMFGVIIIMSLRSSSRQRREQQEMLAKIKKNDKVLTTAGIIGYIVQIKEDETILLKSGDDANSRITVLRSTIVRVIDESAQPGTENKPVAG